MDFTDDDKMSKDEIISFLATLERLDKEVIIQSGLALSCHLYSSSQLEESFKVLYYITNKFSADEISEVVKKEPQRFNTIKVMEKLLEDGNLKAQAKDGYKISKN